MTNHANPLNDPDFMQAFLDTFIPPNADGVMPGAGALGIAAAVATAIEADAALGPIVSAGLAAVSKAALSSNSGGFVLLAPSMRAETVKGVLSHHPLLVNALVRHVYPAYYQHPQVLEALGEPARPPFPEGFEIEPTDPALLAILQSRR